MISTWPSPSPTSVIGAPPDSAAASVATGGAAVGWQADRTRLSRARRANRAYVIRLVVILFSFGKFELQIYQKMDGDKWRLRGCKSPPFSIRSMICIPVGSKSLVWWEPLVSVFENARQ